MKKYEYKTETFDGDATYAKLSNKEHKTLEEFLNKRGSEGWQMIRIEGNIIELNAHVIFMREIQEAKAWKTPDTWQEPYKIDNDSKDYELLKNVMPNGNYID